MVKLGDLQGLWTRSLIVWPDGRRDETTSVSWLQGPNLYADLRFPVPRPAFPGVAGRNDLTLEQVKWLATQEGFAGLLTFDGKFFEWQRTLDYQPNSDSADAGKLWFEDGRMIEEGRDVPYIEHWHRNEQEAPAPNGALRLSDLNTGVAGFLVRAGSFFMYARDRATPLAAHGTLSERVIAAAPEEARALVDCEISFGRIGPPGWRIELSSLPYREGASLWPTISTDLKRLTSEDVNENGAPTMRAWNIMQNEGDMALAEAIAEAS